MARMFYGCTLLEKVNVENFSTSNVKDMNAMFANVISLKKLDLNSFETEKVEDFGSMLTGAYTMEELDISKFTIKEGANLNNFLGGISPNIKVYVKDIDTKNKILVNSKLQENNILIK